MMADVIIVDRTCRAGLGWCSSVASPPAARATAGAKMAVASGWITAVAPISLWKAAEAGIGTMIMIETMIETMMTGIEEATAVRIQSFPARPTTCTSTTVRFKPAEEFSC